MPIDAHQTIAVDHLSRKNAPACGAGARADLGALRRDGLLRLRQVKAFLEEHGDALRNAADLIAGSRAAGHVLGLIESVAHARELTRHIERQLRALHTLLTQDSAHPADSAAGLGRFDIGTSKPEDIRMLGDHLLDLIDEVSGAPGSGCAPERGPAGPARSRHISGLSGE